MAAFVPGPLSRRGRTRATVSPGILRRLAAIAYDLILLIALWLVTIAVLTPLAANVLPVQRGIFQTGLVAVTFLFFGWFWTHGGQTLGMRVWRIRLVRTGGGGVGWREAALRFACAVPSLLPAGAGLWYLALDRERRAAHDIWSDTRLELIPRSEV